MVSLKQESSFQSHVWILIEAHHPHSTTRACVFSIHTMRSDSGPVLLLGWREWRLNSTVDLTFFPAWNGQERGLKLHFYFILLFFYLFFLTLRNHKKSRKKASNLLFCCLEELSWARAGVTMLFIHSIFETFCQGSLVLLREKKIFKAFIFKKKTDWQCPGRLDVMLLLLFAEITALFETRERDNKTDTFQSPTKLSMWDSTRTSLIIRYAILQLNFVRERFDNVPL